MKIMPVKFFAFSLGSYSVLFGILMQVGIPDPWFKLFESFPLLGAAYLVYKMFKEDAKERRNQQVEDNKERRKEQLEDKRETREWLGKMMEHQRISLKEAYSFNHRSVGANETNESRKNLR